MLSKKLIGAAKMQPRCWESVTRRCSTRSASLDWTRDVPRVQATRKMLRVAEELRAPVPRRMILHQPAGIASGASTCNALLIEGGELSRYTRCAINSKFRIESGD